MTQEEKQLLLVDLSARLPYNLVVQIENEIVVLDSICNDDGYYFNFIGNDREGVNIEKIKPYLFPMSSMTKEQREEWQSLMIRDSYGILYHTIDSFDYLYKNHIDIRGLIPMGLAINASELNIY